MVWCALSYGVSSVLASISLGAFVLVRPIGEELAGRAISRAIRIILEPSTLSFYPIPTGA